MKILMVYPRYPPTFWSFKYAMKFIRKKASFPPLGLLTVASLLPENFDLKLIDMNIERLKEKDILWSDMVFISAMEVQKESVKEVVARAKNAGKRVVAGGPLFTTQPDLIRDVDNLILDEAETTLRPFLKDLERGDPERIYTSKIRPDISSTPIPEWSLIDPKKYATMLLQYSRGCPFNCEFCDIAYLNGRVPRTKSPKQVIREIQSLYDTGWKGAVFFVDDNFIGNRKEVKRLLPHLVSWQRDHGYPFTFLTEASIDLADDIELMDMMASANFNKVFLGIETPSEEGLKECNKMQNLSRDLRQSIRTIQDHGMEVMGGFIVGFDSDTENIFQDQIDFIQNSGIVTAMVGILNAIPETPLWERLKSEGRLKGEATGSNTDGTVNFVPRMGKDNLLTGYRRMISVLYSHREYYRRIDNLLEHYSPNTKTRISREDINAFFRSLWRIGIFSSARFHYWKLLIKTLIKRRRTFPRAVEMAIFGHHFHMISKKEIRHLS